jgi:hypothetical protein
LAEQAVKENHRLALLSVGGLYYALPPELRVGPDWLVLMLVAALAIPATISHHRGNWPSTPATPSRLPKKDSPPRSSPAWRCRAARRPRSIYNWIFASGKTQITVTGG